MRTVGLTCHDPGGAVTAGALGVHCPGGAAKDAEGISLAALAELLELLERSRPKTGRIGGAEDGRGRGGSNMGTGAGLGAAAFFAAAEVAVDIAVAAYGPQKKLKGVRGHGWRSLKLQLPSA